MTQEQDNKEPDWKVVAFELANIIDDIEIFYNFKRDMERDVIKEHFPKDAMFLNTQEDKFYIKRFIQFGNYFGRYGNRVIPQYEIKKKISEEMNLRSIMSKTKS